MFCLTEREPEMSELKKNDSYINKMVQGAAIAALYAVLTLILPATTAGTVEFRISEALTMLAALTPAAIPGLTIGCLIANMMHGAIVLDIVFGSLATFLAALMTYLTRKNLFIAAIWPAVFNGIIIGPLLKYAYHLDAPLGILILSVAAGEAVICYLLGIPLTKGLERTHIFKDGNK